MAYTVGQVAQVAGVTVRTLHHYDEIGLLSPSERTGAGYRRYDDADLERLQRILFYRELGFPLEEIAAILDDPQSSPTEHLRRQHQLLTARIKRLQEMATAVEFAMEARKLGIQLTPEERFEVFGDFNPEDHTEEAERRWGGTDAYRESIRRTGQYTKEDWLRNKAENAEWGQRFVALMESGAPADSPAAMDLVRALVGIGPLTSVDLAVVVPRVRGESGPSAHHNCKIAGVVACDGRRQGSDRGAGSSLCACGRSWWLPRSAAGRGCPVRLPASFGDRGMRRRRRQARRQRGRRPAPTAP
jgi:MerR family transcriptional regulator, thiopeptide resistance regulator